MPWASETDQDMDFIEENGAAQGSAEKVAVDLPDAQLKFLHTATVLGAHWGKLLLVPLLAAVVMFGIASLLKPSFTGTTTFIPPQQQQSTGGAALASLGALSSLAGSAGSLGLRTPGDQYVSLMQSVRVSDRIIDRFGLMQVYGETLRVKAREALRGNVTISLGKKDGLITVDAIDHDRTRAAAIANAYVEELRTLTSTIAVTEAQPRRQFFVRQLQATRDRLVSAQVALQDSGLNTGAIKAEPRAAADGYAKLRAELTAAEVRLQTMRSAFADTSAEVTQQTSTVRALRDQVNLLEASSQPQDGASSDYVSKYREFKYQETLFDLYARQFELAKADESREGALIQVVDAAQPPELKSKPRRVIFALAGYVGALALLLGWIIGRDWLRNSLLDSSFESGMRELRQAAAIRRRSD